MVDHLQRGLYEQIIGEALGRDLDALTDSGALVVRRDALHNAEAGDRLALYLGRLVERAVGDLPESDRAQRGIELARSLVDTLARHLEDDTWNEDVPVTQETVLRRIAGRLPDGSIQTVEHPLVPLLDTTLLTNAPGEPRVLSQLLTEIPSAHGIDIVMAFIRRSGLRPLQDALRRHCGEGRRLRVLTTTYTNSTEPEALDQMTALGATVRVSYDTSSTRLHAKSWLFDRGTGISTAYVGSSNLTHSAQVAGLEWNVRLSSARNAPVLDKIRAVVEAYWEGGDFVPYDCEEFLERTEAAGARSTTTFLPPTELRLEPFQERLLEQIEVARDAGRHANLLVAATGTGKTVMAAVDYLRLQKRLDRSRLLFIAHREELLQQSLGTFRHAQRNTSFGELWVGNKKPSRWEHVFASIQSITASGLRDLAPDHFDVVVVDEFHHAKAKTYEALLDHVKPQELLGLTATPERADGLSVLDRFGGKIAAELRLWDAIDQHRLVPFLYYGIHDGTDLSRLGWTRGRGYDVEGLTNIYTQDRRVASLVLDQLTKRVESIKTMRVLGFCVSVDHARFMARVFNESGVPSVAVWGDSPPPERRAALTDLREGKVRVVFSVDLFNEGVDVPTVDTLLLMRPTQSATLFLQQLGRGLRRSDGKHSCLVLDFVGHQRSEFRFDQRFRALLGGTRRDVERQILTGFPFLPAGCHLELEPEAREVVLASICNALPAQWKAKAAELQSVAEARGGDTDLVAFLDETGLDLEDVYAQTRSWSDLRETAGLPIWMAGPDEAAVRRACGRLLHLDDRERLEGYARLLARTEAPKFGDGFANREARLARMLTAQLLFKRVPKETPLDEGLAVLWQHPQVLTELRDLFDVLSMRIAHVHPQLASHPNVPLRVHARYSRLEILAAFDANDRAGAIAWQTGVMWLPEPKVDLLAFTLDKTSGAFSPTTRYRDYAITRELVHWESQSVTRASSTTGQRYQRHATEVSSVMLFARERADNRAFWFLGPARYVKHTGEKPMAITWKLEHPLPGDIFAAFAAAVA